MHVQVYVKNGTGKVLSFFRRTGLSRTLIMMVTLIFFPLRSYFSSCRERPVKVNSTTRGLMLESWQLWLTNFNYLMHED